MDRDQADAAQQVARDDIKEIIMQQAIYCGVPAANTAIHHAEETFAEIEKSK